MGMLKKIFKARRKARGESKARVKAAKTRARQQVKQAAKLDLKRDKLLAGQEKSLLKAEKKGVRAKRKHERKMAKNQLAQLKAGRFNKDNVKRYTGASRLLAPLVVPMAYRTVVKARELVDERRAKRLGVPPEELGRFTGYGAPLRARIAGMRKNLEASNLGEPFTTDAGARLDDLDTAVVNAEHMTPQLRQRSHRSIASDLDVLAREIERALGV